MAETVFTFDCPCCNKRIEIDTRSGKARAVRPTEAKGGQDLDQLLRSQKQHQKKLDDMFRQAKDSESLRSESLQKQLERAKDEARRDKDERPRNPFDLD
ncbi:MAG: hypothetical protein MUC36_05260 [Planctomycetes bacterium]|jgi:hypothetical protein|nr:hypothetical protein [Planctomycetota bacterium]